MRLLLVAGLLCLLESTVATQLTATDVTNQIVLGTTNTLTFNSPAPSASRTIGFPDPGTTGADVVYTQLVQTIAAAKTFSGALTLTGANTFANTFTFDNGNYENFRVLLSTTSTVYGRTLRISNNHPQFALSYNWYRTPVGTPTAYAYDLATLPQMLLNMDDTGALWYVAQAAGTAANTLDTATPYLYIDVTGKTGLGTSSPTEILHVVGNIKTTGGVYLPTSGGTATLLNYYEEYQLTSTCSGPWTSRNCYVDVTRIGRMVFLSTNTAVSAASSVPAAITWATALPTRFRPSATLDCQPTFVGGVITNDAQCGVVSSTGIITLYNDHSQSGFPSGSSVGWASQIPIAQYHV